MIKEKETLLIYLIKNSKRSTRTAMYDDGKGIPIEELFKHVEHFKVSEEELRKLMLNLLLIQKLKTFHLVWLTLLKTK
jgi:hypothetical protein